MSTQDVPAHLRGLIAEDDYISEEALVAAERFVARIPQGFVVSTNAYAKTIQITLKFDEPLDVRERVRQADALVTAALAMDSLTKNLRAERQHQLPEVTS